MNLIFLGAPGAGKGTLAAVVSKRLAIPTISTGNMIREAMQNGTTMGKRAEEYVDAGKLVPDDVVIGIIKERLAQPDCAAGFILDGFPRTIPQAEALGQMGICIDYALNIDIADTKIVARMAGRRVCPSCGASYHIVNIKPKVEGVCDECSTTLMQRKDDDPQTVLDRLAVYHEQTEPLKGFYHQRGKLRNIDGEIGVEKATQLIYEAIGAGT